MALAYRLAGLRRGAATDQGLVRALQRDLRALGYLYRHIDGGFGTLTEAAVRSLQYDLLDNDGTGTDGKALARIKDFNRGVGGITGIVDPALADSIEALLSDDERVPKLPSSRNPAADNRTALAAISRAAGKRVPVPFLRAIFQHESGCQHYAVPNPPGDEDNYVIVGLDRDRENADHIVSRGYGIGQYTLFHHPPRPDEVRDFIADPSGNVQKAVDMLAEKFANFVRGKDGAWDYRAEHPALASLRPCRYGLSDRTYMNACRDCAAKAGKQDLKPNTPLYTGSRKTYGHAYRNVPDRADFLCDWPYAVRRYNGCGPNSFNYQAIVLGNLLAPDNSSQESGE